MDEKRKWPHAEAFAAATELVAALGDHVLRIEIAGSLRRQKPQVGDIELLMIPKVIELPDPESVFGEVVATNMTDARIKRLEATGVLARRKNVKGSEMFGEKNKLMVHVATGIPVDLFATTEASWFNYLVCRTGPLESNVAICNAAIGKGWKWEPYSPGFKRIGYTEPMHSERQVFEFVGLPYHEPQFRK